MTPTVPIPLDFQSRRTASPGGRRWLATLPGLLDAALERWELVLDLAPGAEPWTGHAAVVVPVRTSTGARAALKISYPYEEARLEATALRLWNGRGTVRLLAADQRDCAVLLERLDAGRPLHSLPMDESVAVWGLLMRQLSVAAGDEPDWAAFPHIAAAAERYTDELPARWETLGRPFPLWLLEAALEVCQTRGIVGRRSSRDVLVHTDLHFMNVLGRLDAPGFVAIDPQAAIGDAEFAVAPCLWNRITDLPRRAPEAGLRARCTDLCAAAGLDAGVAAEWAVVREVENALEYLARGDRREDAQRSLWVAATMAGRVVPGLPSAHELKPLV